MLRATNARLREEASHTNHVELRNEIMYLNGKTCHLGLQLVQAQKALQEANAQILMLRDEISKLRPMAAA